MTSIQVDILNPKAKRLLKELESQKLITIKELRRESDFSKTLKKLRAKGKAHPISLEEISKEVELVRTKRYARKKV